MENINKTITNLNSLKINKLSQEQYNYLVENNQINPNELYLTPDENEINLGDGQGSISLNRKNGTTLYENSVVLGNENEVTDAYATATGDQTKAYWRAHSEGYLTEAIGSTSHAEGRITIASGKGSHAEGSALVKDFTTEVSLVEPVAITSNLIKVNVPPSELNDCKFIQIRASNQTASFVTTDTKKVENIEADGAMSILTLSSPFKSYNYNEADTPNNSGILPAGAIVKYEVPTIASGAGSHAEGRGTEASGIGAHAEGYGSVGSGDNSHAEGYKTIVSGPAGHAEGSQTEVTAEAGHAEGFKTIAASKYSHVQGKYNEIDENEEYAHIVGWGSSDTDRRNIHTLSTSGNAWFQGEITTGNDKKKIATEQYVDDAIADFSVDKSSGTNSIIMNKITGNKANVASGSYSTAKGYGNTASGDYSHAEGYGNNTAGIASHIEGSNSVINVGTTTNTKDTSEGSHAEGMSTIAHGKAQHVQGKFNLEDTEINNSGYGKYAHIVGNGTSVKRSNAHTITWDGDAWFAGTIACKYNITSNTPGTAEFNTEITALEEGQILYVVEEYAI